MMFVVDVVVLVVVVKLRDMKRLGAVSLILVCGVFQCVVVGVLSITNDYFLSFDLPEEEELFLKTFEKMPPSFFVDGEADDPDAAEVNDDEEDEEETAVD